MCKLETNSSIHCINADRKLWPHKKFLWFACNILNNHISPSRAEGFTVEPFPIDTATDVLDSQLKADESPARAVSNLFWQQLDWQFLSEELGDLCVFDSGCGMGKYALNLQRWSGDRIASYVGADIKRRPTWPGLMEEHGFIKLLEVRAREFHDVIPKNTNLIISQSAIEHFEDDLVYFHNIRKFIAQQQRPLMQIHLFPSAACLRLYRKHGVRQYTPRTVSKIVSIFQEYPCCATLFNLGGKGCNALHIRAISRPRILRKLFGLKRDWRDVQRERYKRELIEAIGTDVQNGSASPTFYALIMQTHFKNSIYTSQLPKSADQN